MKYHVLVSKGMFANVSEAAFGEKKVDWKTRTGAKECIECFLAYDLRENLEKIKNDAVEIFDVNDFSFGHENSDKLIIIGKKNIEAFCGKYSCSFDLKAVDNGSYVIKSETVNNIPVVLLYGGDDEGTRNAVISYMELLGLCFISPDENGTYYLKEADFENKNDFDIVNTPSYKTRGAFSSFINNSSTEFFMWLFHNKLNFVHLKEFEIPEFIKKLCLSISAGGHDTFYKYMDVNHEYPYCHKIAGGEGKPEDPYPVSRFFNKRRSKNKVLTYGEAHPEWYAEVEGVRRCFRNYEEARVLTHYTGDYICTSNEDGTSEMIRLLVDALADGEWMHVDYFNLWALDNGTWCTCPDCLKDKTLSYRQLMFAYKLDKAIKKAKEEGRIKRDIKIIIPAYHETLEAPDKPLPEDFDYNNILVIFFVIERCYQHYIDDPVCQETNQMLIDYLNPWFNGYYKGEMMIGEYYNVSSFSNMPFILTDKMAHDISYYHNNGARHLHYMHFTARKWGVFAINNYLYGKVLFDVDCDAEKVCDDYYKARYGKHWEYMKNLYKALEKTTANCKYWKHYQYIHKKRRSLAIDVNERNRYLMDCEHIQLAGRSNSPESGISFNETKRLYKKLYEDFKGYMESVDDISIFKDDFIQLEYGYNTICFMCAMANYVYNNTGASNLVFYYEAKKYAELLKATTEPLKGYDKNLLFTDGLKASRLEDAFNEISKEVEKILNSNSPLVKVHRCPVTNEQFKVTNEYNLKDRGVVTPHWHNEYEFLICVDGEATHMLNSRKYTMKKGDVVLMSPTDYHLFLYDEGQTISYKRLKFKHTFYNKYLKDIFNFNDLPYIITVKDETYDKLVKILDLFMKEAECSNVDRRKLMCTNCIIEAMALVSREKDENIVDNSVIDPVKAAMSYVQKNFKNNISVKDIADAVKYSQNYLSVLFIKTIGISCKNYLMDVRLDYAYNLIKYSNVSMKIVCVESGFNSLSYFSNAFKAKYGMSPKQMLLELDESTTVS